MKGAIFMYKKISNFTLLHEQISKNIPFLNYVARYSASNEDLNAIIKAYEHRAFVYILSVEFNNYEHFIYVGKSRSQYARLLMHKKKFEFDYIYLYECDDGHLNKCEKQLIKLLSPIYNKQMNPVADKFSTLLSINYDTPKSKEETKQYIELYNTYLTTGTYCFLMPSSLYSLIKDNAEESGISCSQQIQLILEKHYGDECIRNHISRTAEEECITNLTTIPDYAVIHNKSVEQIKQYIYSNRLLGAFKICRDWLIPVDTPLPDDRRRKHRNIIRR